MKNWNFRISLPILAVLVISAGCTFSPHPKSGVQVCSPRDRYCPNGYVCGADNKCWLPEDVPAVGGAVGTSGDAGSGMQTGDSGVPVNGQGGVSGASTGITPIGGSSTSPPPTSSAPESNCSFYGNAGPGALWSVSHGGYVVSGPWAGYAWTAIAGTGSTIAPTDYAAVTSGGRICASGTVAPMADHSGVAMIGIELRQASGTKCPSGTWTPSGTGVVVNVSSPGRSPLRVQIQGPNGATDANDRWCAPLLTFDQPVSIPWSAFNTACWDNSGTAYKMQPLQSAAVYVPGDNKVSISFNYCVSSIGSYTGTAVGTGGTSGSSGICLAPSETERLRASQCVINGSVYLLCPGTTPGTTNSPPCCAQSYPYYCSVTDKCYSTQANAQAACGGNTCGACVNANGNCTQVCTGLKKLNPTTCNCECSSNICGPDERLNPATCGCDCSRVCGANEYLLSATCTCVSSCTKTCPAGQILSKTSCLCL